MATCKDCLHYKSCGGFIPTDLDRDVFHYCREGRSDEISDIEERCSDFNDRRNYVEVVRCKDCKYWCEDTLSCTIGNHYDDNWYAEDFCSYGKKNANADPEGEIDFDYNAED